MYSNSKAYQQLLINKKFIELIKPLNQKSIVLDIGANIGNVSNFILEKKDLRFLHLNQTNCVLKF